jgi:hypothetical protein
MKRLVTTLGATLAALAVSAGTAFAADPVQSSTQSSNIGQGAIAASSATQIQPSNSNISVRVLSPGNDGNVTQSNDATSSANASNDADTTQKATQSSMGCSCVVKDGKIDGVLGTAMQAAAPQGATGQSNTAGSSGTAANTAPTSQTSTQAAPSGGGSGVQSSTQDAKTGQLAGAASSATQIAPSNSNISVRVLSPGNDGNVTQSNTAKSSADASNDADTSQNSTQDASGSGGVQFATQDATTLQGALAESSAKQIHPENSSTSVRVGSFGNGGSVKQSNTADSSADASNDADVDQTVSQDPHGKSSCGCGGSGDSVQAAGQSSKVLQGAFAASSATQIKPSNENNPVRIASFGNDGSVDQSNTAKSDADASNDADVDQTAEQEQEGGSCGCSHDPSVQALGQSSFVGQAAIGLSSAKQVGAENENGPIRVWSPGGAGSVTQSNTADSSADASNDADVSQDGSQAQDGSGIQALGQDSSVFQLGFAASSAAQLPGKSECGCGHSFGNSNDPVRIYSFGNDGSVKQDNTASSSADASNSADVDQSAEQEQDSPSCGCHGLGIQALGQESNVGQLAKALSSSFQLGAKNSNGPVRVWSPNLGSAGSTSQSNASTSDSDGSNDADVSQTGRMFMV